MVNSVQNTGAPASTQATPLSSAGSVANQQDRFLKLLVTQMKNQDPLNPMDNAQVTSQMAQLSTVTGIDKLNSTVQSLSDNMTASQTLSATSMIGHGVLVAGSKIDLSNSQAIGGVDLTQPADSVKVLVKDAAGNLVRTLQLGAQKAGVAPLTWDGLNDAGVAVSNGSYTLAAEATSAGKTSAATTLSFGMVGGVTPTTSGAQLDVGNLGKFNLSAVKQVM